MGLVDYGSSDSEPEAPPAPPKPSTASKPVSATSKKPFQKVVDRSHPGKILVNLPTATQAQQGDEPPAKRARTGAAGGGSGGRFSGFNSFLPPPKNPDSKTSGSLGQTSGGGRSGVSLKTGAAPAFSRDGDDGQDVERSQASPSSGMVLPPAKKLAEPSIPEGQKPAEEVKMVGKPMMFRPLSVSRGNNKKKATSKSGAPRQTINTPPTSNSPKPAAGSDTPAPAPPPKKPSLFSMHIDEPSTAGSSQRESNGVYEPILHTEVTGPDQDDNATTAPDPQHSTQSHSLDSVADELNLSAAARRELFGRSGGANGMVKNVINFNMDQEYRHNEAIRAAGEQQIHNPVRSIQAAGKNSLRSLVQNVQSQREALEDSFAKGKSNRKEASGKYGW